MPDMTEWEQYGAGYRAAEFDISTKGIDIAEVAAKYDRPSGNDPYSVGYQTCVNVWKEGVRL